MATGEIREKHAQRGLDACITFNFIKFFFSGRTPAINLAAGRAKQSAGRAQSLLESAGISRVQPIGRQAFAGALHLEWGVLGIALRTLSTAELPIPGAFFPV